MAAIMQELINYMIAFGGLIGILFFGLNFLTKGFILQYLKVKASQGKKILMRIKSPTDTYYRAAIIIEGRLLWKDRSKDEKSIPFTDSEFGRFVNHEMGISVISINEVGNVLLDADGRFVKVVNMDPGRTESLILKIKNRPSIMDKRTTFILLGIGLLVIICVVIGIKVFKTEELLTSLAQNITVNIR